MSTFILLVVVAAIGGIAVTLQAQFMGLMDSGMGTLESMFITYGSGAALISIAILLLRGANLGAWRHVPSYALTAGVLGLIIIGAIGYTVPRLGLVPALTILVAAQFIAAGLINHFGILGASLQPLDLTRLLGMAVVLFGIWLIIR